MICGGEPMKGFPGLYGRNVTATFLLGSNLRDIYAVPPPALPAPVCLRRASLFPRSALQSYGDTLDDTQQSVTAPVKPHGISPCRRPLRQDHGELPCDPTGIPPARGQSALPHPLPDEQSRRKHPARAKAARANHFGSERRASRIQRSFGPQPAGTFPAAALHNWTPRPFPRANYAL